MDIFLMILGSICVIVGLLGSFIPVLPGTPISYVGLLLLLFVDGCSLTLTFFLVWLGIIALQQVLEYFIPIWGVKKFGGSKAGQWGSIIGLIVGLFFLPIGLIVGPFLGAIIGELWVGKNTQESVRAGFGSLVGNLAGMTLGLVLSAIMAYYYFAEVAHLISL